MRDLPPPEGAPCSDGFAINNRNDVVGVANDCEGNQLAVVLWHKGVPYDLSALIPPTQLTLGEFEYIDDRGEIVGRATLPTGDVHEVMLVPASRPGPAALAAMKPQGPLGVGPGQSARVRVGPPHDLRRWGDHPPAGQDCLRLAQRIHGLTDGSAGGRPRWPLSRTQVGRLGTPERPTVLPSLGFVQPSGLQHSDAHETAVAA